ncbi:ubiquitin C-terminal hydrolase 12-like isoform X2 [Cannabis sativa]|uniref:ubiquitin C-terminal hydrolase 12-like isoform X2 n=1 Tax=Cannabis sativa TaxID=3483 RepID=UPI0029CA2BAD|nr:ubiquitin C-terminal hydrolase 12-like isoform X2 [Cannabis sativa]
MDQSDARVRRFHTMKPKWGFARFMDLQTFNNPSNGYLVNDTCKFGAEIFIVKTASKVERLSMINNPLTCKFSWTFHNISRENLERYQSSSFVGGDYKWSIVFYPNGQSNEKSNNNCCVVGLALDSTLPPDTSLFVHLMCRMRDQKYVNHFRKTDSKTFSSKNLARGFEDYMPLTKLNDPENGFLVGDRCIIDVEFKVLGLVTLE